jgi:DNA-directed RNA polymerase I, II, and III subunit RPABC1
MELSFEEKKNLYKVRNTIIEMLNDRGYNYKDNIDFNDFSVLLDSNNINILLENEMYVYFYNEYKNFGKNEFKNIVLGIQKEHGESINIIIVLREPENSPVKTEMLKPIYKNVELFLQKRLTFNITKHELVPKHQLLNEEEILEIEEKYNTNRSMFPKMLSNDPISKYYNARPGSMFKIERKSHSSGYSVGYRIVK